MAQISDTERLIWELTTEVERLRMDKRDMDAYDERWFALHAELDECKARIEAALNVLHNPPVPSRMLIPVVRAALVGPDPYDDHCPYLGES